MHPRGSAIIRKAAVGLFVSFLLASSVWASHQARQVTTSTLNVRSGPGTSYSIIGAAHSGEKYVVVGASGSWYKIYWAGNTGWFHGGYTTAASGTGVQISVSALNVRTGPGTTYSIVGTAHSPEIYVLAGASGSWKQIWFGGAARWVYGSYTTAHALGSTSTTTDGDVLTYGNGHPLSTATTDPAILGVEDEVHQLVNNHRVSRGLNALVMHDPMRRCARAHSKHMAIHAFFAHTNPEGDDPFQRMTKCGITYSWAGENLAAGYSSASAAVQGWLDSAGHRANIESANYTHTGVGTWNQSGSPYGKYYGQLFAGNPN